LLRRVKSDVEKNLLPSKLFLFPAPDDSVTDHTHRKGDQHLRGTY